ncbi:TPA: WC1-like [Bos taurus]|nr:TPA: WC1-like [Bos taurus]
MALGRHLSLLGLCVLLLGTMVGGQGNQTQVLPQCNDSVSEPAGSEASEESAPYCSDSRQLRLVDGGGHCAGRVEILDQASWGTISDDGWDLDDARVVCRQLGCGQALNATRSAHFGAESGPIWLDDLKCTGKESHVWRKKTQELSNCCPLHRGVTGGAAAFSDREKLQLRGGDTECSGRVVWHSGSWGTVGDDSWSLAEAEVVCPQLGCGQALEAMRATAFGPGNGSIWLDEVRCKENIDPTAAGSRPVSSPLPGIFSLPGVLCLILGSLLFLVLIILVTQVFRWIAEHRALSSYEDALAEAVYDELDHLVTQKEGLLGSPDQKTYALGEDYDDAEEVLMPGAHPTSQGSEEEVLPKKEDGMRSQTGDSSLNIFREEADPGEGEESPWLFQGEKVDRGYEDVELSALGTSTVTFP